MAQQERPRVDEVDPVHGHHDDAVPALETPGQTVLDEEGVREHEAVLLIPEEDGSLSAWTHLVRSGGGEGEDNGTDAKTIPLF